LEVLTAFYKHPIEIFFNSILSSAILYLLLGLGKEAAGIAVTLTAIGELFYHWNVRTPYWVGFIFQRPESHCIHHQHGVHHFNYSDLPLWDMLFGTFRNPKKWDGACGLGEAELQLSKMIRGEVITASSTAAGSHS
jgi:sterol desaturase/sphingolipid hydroxylase (fatty acid hydroxylase superfamily)